MLSRLTIKMASPAAKIVHFLPRRERHRGMQKKRTEKESNSPQIIITAAQVVKHKETIYPSGWAR
jgi:hypothetical protein